MHQINNYQFNRKFNRVTELNSVYTEQNRNLGAYLNFMSVKNELLLDHPCVCMKAGEQTSTSMQSMWSQFLDLHDYRGQT